MTGPDPTILACGSVVALSWGAINPIDARWRRRMKKIVSDDQPLTISEIQMTEMQFYVVGKSPLVPHAVSAKAKGALLFPSPKKTTAERATSMKHEPYEEFVDACYRFRDEDEQPTRLYMPAGAFHGAMAQAAIDCVGAKKAQIGRLTTVIGGKVPVFGVPQIYMTVVKSSGIERTPDVRTLPILPQWACTFTVQFVGSLIKPASIGNLLGAAGIIVGVGDGRPEKGKLSMGQFRLCGPDDVQYKAITRQARAAQDKAISDPAPFDIETEQLLAWFEREKGRRVAQPAPEARSKRRGGNGPTLPAHLSDGPTRPDASRHDVT